MKADSTNSVFDAMLIPALNFAERDRIEGLLSNATLADDGMQPLLDAGASHVAALLLDTRKFLAEAAHVGTEVAMPVAAA